MTLDLALLYEIYLQNLFKKLIKTEKMALVWKMKYIFVCIWCPQTSAFRVWMDIQHGFFNQSLQVRLGSYIHPRVKAFKFTSHWSLTSLPPPYVMFRSALLLLHWQSMAAWGVYGDRLSWTVQCMIWYQSMSSLLILTHYWISPNHFFSINNKLSIKLSKKTYALRY